MKTAEMKNYAIAAALVMAAQGTFNALGLSGIVQLLAGLAGLGFLVSTKPDWFSAIFSKE